MKKDIHDYTGLYDMEHPALKHHKRMSAMERAAQFMPFSALTGYEESLSEEERKTETRKLIVPEEKENIRNLLTCLFFGEKKEAEVLYFVEDTKKEGGHYFVYRGKVRRVDEVNQVVVFEDGTRISFSDIDGIRIF